MFLISGKWKWKSLSPVGLFVTPWTSPWNSPGLNTGVGNLSLLQGSSRPRNRTQVSHITGRFFTTWVTREVKADPRSSVKRQVFHQWYTQGGWVSETLYWVEEARVRITVWSRLYSSDILKQVKPWSWRRDHSAEGQSEEKTRRWRHREGPTRCLI